ncbi:hypothetical protein GMA7_88 [Gordonia phage GMA7]|uniref:Uncharacterized protein n=1 Tax=Gordonia phage GMA7 TaxID=1647286 RepID=A0A0K0N6S0_9CAUD|nr:hypothetical protein AU104_gp030 [Gordonia phage GMA7]AKJ72525.1 hypothetical protein GMA7_88 [Gordonia phage GMA7]
MTDYAQLAKDIVEATLLYGVDPDDRDNARDIFMSEMHVGSKSLIWDNDSATGIVVKFWEHNGKAFAEVVGNVAPTHTFERPINALDCAAWASDNMC